MRFEFATATRIVFGPGACRDAGSLAAELGNRPLIVTGNSPARAAGLLKLLPSYVPFSFAGEPSLETVGSGLTAARQHRCDSVIAFGGGSALDAGKAIAALMTNTAPIEHYLEVVGKGQPLSRAPAPFMAIPTTAGTGAEVTRNAVLFAPEHRVKVSLRSPLLLPRIAIIDPELTHDLPPAITASTGMDALTQVIEPFLSARANPLTDAICREGMTRAARALRRAYVAPDSPAREDMAFASLCGGLALANAGLGAVHGFAAPIGGMFDAPHGAVCAALLPEVMEANWKALSKRQPASPVLMRFAEVAAILTGQAGATASDGIHWIRVLRNDLKIPALRTYGIQPGHISELCAKASVASSMKANPVTLDAHELAEILNLAL